MSELTRRDVLAGSMSVAAVAALPEMALAMSPNPAVLFFDDDGLGAAARRMLAAEGYGAAGIDLRVNGVTDAVAAAERLGRLSGYVLASAHRAITQELVETLGAWSFRVVLFGQGPTCVNYGGHTTVFLRAGPPMVRRFGHLPPRRAA